MSNQAGRIIGRSLMYGTILFIVAASAQIYVANPLYVKRLPYFADAFAQRFQITCTENADGSLENILKDVSLPFFSLTGSIRKIDASAEVSACRVQDPHAKQAPNFRFASMTKVVTTFAVLDLLETHSISLDTPFLEFFPEIDKNRVLDSNLSEVTIRHLLNHESGFGGPFGSDNMVKENEKPWCPYQLNDLESVRLAGQPGSNHLYTNVAYCLLGEIVTRLSGVEYQKYVEQNYLSQYPSLQFAQGGFLPSEPEYDFSNDYRFDQNYVSWLDFHANAPAAGLMGKPEEFAELIWALYQSNPGVLQSEGVKSCRKKELERCYSNTFVVYDGPNGHKVGVQQGYLPGASSLVAVSTYGEVLVWTAPGAPLESYYRDKMANKVVELMLQRE